MKAHVPTKLTRDQRKLLEDLRQALGGDGSASAGDEERPFFERVKDIFG
jgi:DnaJ-class molecular chaperone